MKPFHATAVMAAILLVLQACTYHGETNVDLAAAPTDDRAKTDLNSAFQDKVRLKELQVSAPGKGAKLGRFGLKQTSSRGSHTASTNSFILDSESEPMFRQALANVFAADETSRLTASVDASYRLRSQQAQDFWHKYVYIMAHLNMDVVLTRGQTVVYRRTIKTTGQDDYSLLFQAYPSESMVRELMQKALDKAVKVLSEDADLLALMQSAQR